MWLIDCETSSMLGRLSEVSSNDFCVLVTLRQSCLKHTVIMRSLEQGGDQDTDHIVPAEPVTWEIISTPELEIKPELPVSWWAGAGDSMGRPDSTACSVPADTGHSGWHSVLVTLTLVKTLQHSLTRCVTDWERGVTSFHFYLQVSVTTWVSRVEQQVPNTEIWCKIFEHLKLERTIMCSLWCCG